MPFRMNILPPMLRMSLLYLLILSLFSSREELEKTQDPSEKIRKDKQLGDSVI